MKNATTPALMSHFYLLLLLLLLLYYYYYIIIIIFIFVPLCFLILMLNNMEKWIGLLCANVFLLKTTLAYTVVFTFTLTFSLGANNLSHYIYIYIYMCVAGWPPPTAALIALLPGSQLVD